MANLPSIIYIVHFIDFESMKIQFALLSIILFSTLMVIIPDDVSAQTDGIILESVDSANICGTDLCRDNLFSVHFADSLNGWAVGNSETILYTDNGGISWTKQFSGDVNVAIKSVYFTDVNNGWAVGDSGTILYTNDKGNTWQRQEINVETFKNINLKSVYFTDVNNGWAVGDSGTILYTNDKGNTWQRQEITTDVETFKNINLKSVHFVDSKIGRAVGDIGGKTAPIIYTNDGGVTWHTKNIEAGSIFLQSKVDLKSVYFADGNNGWAVGDTNHKALILHTIDGGESWDNQSKGIDLSMRTELQSVHFVGSNGFAVGYNLHTGVGIVLHTTDDDDSWSKLAVTSKELHSVHVVDNNNAFAVGDYNSSQIHRIFEPIALDTIKFDGGSSSDWKKKPTFGKSWEISSVQLVENGFVFNGRSFDITDNYHTDFNNTDAIIGETNHVDIKVYTDKILKYVALSLGVPEVGDVSNAESNIIVHLQRNYTIPQDYTITEIVHEQKESLVDTTKTVSTISKAKCTDSSPDVRCYVIGIDFTVTAPLKSKVLAISAVDTDRRDIVTYLNEGISFTGDALLAPVTHSIVEKKSSQHAAETILLTQQDRRYNIWEDQHGYLWSSNSDGSWLQITTPDFKRHTDTSSTAMTRSHSEFAHLMTSEAGKAALVFDSATIQNEVGESLTYAYPTVLDRSLDPILLENMELDEILALEKLLNRFIYDDGW